MATYPVNTLCGGCGGHRDQVHARCGWPYRLREVVWENKSMKKDWNLESESCGASAVLTTRTWYWMLGEGEGVWLGRRSVQRIIVLLSTTRFLKCVLRESLGHIRAVPRKNPTPLFDIFQMSNQRRCMQIIIKLPHTAACRDRIERPHG